MLYSSILDDRHIGTVLDAVDTWSRLTPEEREAMIADVDRATEQLITELDPPPTDRDDEGPGPILSDAW